MKRAAIVRVAVMLGAAAFAIVAMSRIEDRTISQISGVVIALAGLIVSRLIYARMVRRDG